MILITSFGEFPFILLLSVIIIFIYLFQFTVKKKKKSCCRIFFFLFGVVLGCPVLAVGEHVPVD